MDDRPLAQGEMPASPPERKRRSNQKEGWKWYLGAVFVLIAGVPALVLLVFYYRTVAATYYMTRNPLEPSSLHLSRIMETVLVGNMRALSATAESLGWTGSPPAKESLRKKIGIAIQSGDLRGFAGWAVIDRKGTVLAGLDRRDIDPYLDLAKSLAHEILFEGGHYRFRTIAVPGRTPTILLLVAVSTGGPGSGGVLVGLQNLSSLMNRYMLVPTTRSSPGHSYLISSTGLVLASSDRSMVGKNLSDLGRKAVLERFRSGKSGSFVKTIDGQAMLYGSTLLVDLTGLSSENWFAVLEAPKSVIDAHAERIRLNMDLIVFLLVPAFMGIVLYLLYRSLRA